MIRVHFETRHPQIIERCFGHKVPLMTAPELKRPFLIVSQAISIEPNKCLEPPASLAKPSFKIPILSDDIKIQGSGFQFSNTP